MNITVLTYLEADDSKEFDPVVKQISDALRSAGHKPSILGVHGDVSKLIAGLRRRKPDLVFNVMEMFGDNLFCEGSVAGLLELLNLPFTGCGAAEFTLQQDKGLTKKLLAFDSILYPDFAVFSVDSALETGGKLRMPLFVKPLRADASIGIGGHSLVRSSTDLMERILAIHKEVKDSALVEEFIEGREFYVGVIGNQEPIAFPPMEMDFTGLAEESPHILDKNAKWEEGTAEFAGTKAILPDLPDELRAKLQRVALDAYRALRVRDYGRVDIRMTEAGEIYVLEVNANCYLDKSSEFATAAAAHGIEYPELINRIVNFAVERYKDSNPALRRMSRKKLPALKKTPAPKAELQPETEPAPEGQSTAVAPQ